MELSKRSIEERDKKVGYKLAMNTITGEFFLLHGAAKKQIEYVNNNSFVACNRLPENSCGNCHERGYIGKQVVSKNLVACKCINPYPHVWKEKDHRDPNYEHVKVRQILS